MRPLLSASAPLAAGLFLLAGPAAAEIDVVASIKPVHALTAAVMQGAGTPRLLVQGSASPHAMSLKPSDARALQEAEVVIWIGEGLETFLVSPLESLAGKAHVVELAEAEGLTLLPYRAGGAWEDHDDHDEEHEEHGHDDHAHEEHAHEHEEHEHEEHAHEHEEHEHEEHAQDAHDHGHDHAHDHGGDDMHLWLDPQNAKAMVAAIAEALSEADPDNSGIYLANARATALRLDELSEEIARELAPVKDVPFVVFHDAFQYLDTAFGLNNVGSITVSPEQSPGAARLTEIHEKIEHLNARCVFAEPQFEPRLVQVVIEGTEAKTGTLDPLGAALTDGPELYFEMMRENAASLKACLGEAS